MLKPLACIALLLLPHLALAAKPPVFQPDDVFALEWASDPQLSPNGRQVVYRRNFMDVMADKRDGRLWLANTDGSGQQKLTSREVGESSPRWSPSGDRIAFVSSTEQGSEVYVYWVDTGKLAKLTQLERSPSGLSWSPDGNWLAFSMLVPQKAPVLVKGGLNKPKGAKWAEPARVTDRLKYEQDGRGYLETGFSHFFVLPAEGGTARQVTDGDFHHRGTPTWGANSKTLYFSANRNAGWERAYRNSEVYALDIASGEIQALTERDGPDHSPQVSPDGKTIAFLGYADKVQNYQVTQLHLMDIDGSNQRVLGADLDRSIEAFRWVGKELLIQYQDQADGKVAKLNPKTDKWQVLAENLGGTSVARPYSGGSFSANSHGQVAYTQGRWDRPADLVFVDGKKQRQLTQLNEDVLAYRTLGEVREIRYQSTVDQRDLQGWIVLPPDYEQGKTYPLLVENKGGPTTAYGAWFSPEIQLYAAAGYLVFYPNPRGSTSYGEEFGNQLYNNYPGDDYQDVMDGVDHLLTEGLTEENKLYVTGGSAGGIMSAWMIGKSDRFRAAAVIKPVMNWISKTLVADNYYGYAEYRYPGQPWENVENYWRFSPVSLVGQINTPTLVMVGSLDMRTPLSEAKQLYNALQIRDVDTVLVEMPGAYHFIANRPSQLVSKVQHILAWLEKYPPEAH